MIYDARPKQCRVWRCDWLDNETMPDYWYPLKSKMAIHASNQSTDEDPILSIFCDIVGVWRRKPYRSHIEYWSRQGEIQIWDPNGLAARFVKGVCLEG
jgi:hypothetical protein